MKITDAAGSVSQRGAPASAWSGARSVSVRELSAGFLRIGLMGFGGVAAIARHEIVDRRNWLDDAEYGQVLGLGKILPGANTVNCAVIIGDRFAGPIGAFASLAALMAMPLVIVVGILVAYDRFANIPEVANGLQGVAAAAAGMVIGTALKLLGPFRSDLAGLLFAGMTVLAITFFRLPLAATLGLLAPFAIVWTFVRSRYANGG